MNCRFDEKIYHLYADGELGESARRLVEEHLETCYLCKAKFESIIFIKDQMREACLKVQAPAYLRTRIIANLEGANRPGTLQLGFFERLNLIIMNFRSARMAALGIIFSLVMLAVLLPGRRGLSKVAGDLAHEYTSWHVNNPVEFLSTGDPGEAEQYIVRNLGIHSEIPSALASDMMLVGVGLADLNGDLIAHARYSDGKMDCSMFIFEEKQPGHKPSATLVAAGQEYEISSSADVNLLCWHKDKMNYVLCGCCCFEKLSQLAMSTI